MSERMTAAAKRQLAARKQIRAVQLRSIGQTFEQIAAALLPCDDHRPNGRHDCAYCVPMYPSRASALKAYRAGMRDEYGLGAELREEQRQHTLAQIDLVLQRAMPESLDRQNPDRNEAARVVQRYLALRMRLLGLEAPARIQITTELDEQIRQLVDELEEGATSR